MSKITQHKSHKSHYLIWVMMIFGPQVGLIGLSILDTISFAITGSRRFGGFRFNFFELFDPQIMEITWLIGVIPATLTAFFFKGVSLKRGWKSTLLAPLIGAALSYPIGIIFDSQITVISAGAFSAFVFSFFLPKKSS